MNLLRAAAILVVASLAASAEPPASFQCRDLRNGGFKTMPFVVASKPNSCPQGQPLDAYSIDLLSGWRDSVSWRDAQICNCYFPSNIAACQVARNWLYDVRHRAPGVTPPPPPCLAALMVGLYDNEVAEVGGAVRNYRAMTAQ